MWKDFLIVMRLNVKMVWGEQGNGPENRTSNIPISSNLISSFPQTEWNNLDMLH